MIHACEKCGKRWACTGEGCGDAATAHSHFCIDCFRAILAEVGQQLVLVECRVCTAKRWCQCAVGFDAENLPCPTCGAEAMDAVAA